MRVAVTFDRGVARDVRTAIATTLEGLCLLSPVRHRLRVRVVPHPTVASVSERDGRQLGIGFGVFCPELRLIVVCGGAAALVKPRRDGVRVVAESLCHEFVHYEQFRDDKPLTDRNVARRAASLLRRIEATA